MTIAGEILQLEHHQNKLVLYKDQILELMKEVCKLYCSLYDAREGRRADTMIELPFHIIATVRDTFPDYIVLRKVYRNKWGDCMAVKKSVISINLHDMYVIESKMKNMFKKQ